MANADDNQKRKPSLLQWTSGASEEAKKNYSELSKVRRDLSSIGFSISENALIQLSLLQEQESGDIDGDRNFRMMHEKYLGTRWPGRLGEFLNKNLTINRFPVISMLKSAGLDKQPKSLGSFQINIEEFRRVLHDKTFNKNITTILKTFPLPSIGPLLNPDILSYDQLNILVNAPHVAVFYVNYVLNNHLDVLDDRIDRLGAKNTVEPADLRLTAHFAHNHSPSAMYSAIVIMNILKLARSPGKEINFRDHAQKSYWNMFTGNKERIVLDGEFNKPIAGITDALRKKGVNLDIKTNNKGHVVSVDGIRVTDFEGLKSIFPSFYPSLQSSFLKANESWLHADYIRRFYKSIENISAGEWAKQFEGPLPAETDESRKVKLMGELSYELGSAHIMRDVYGNAKGSVDCISALQYMNIESDILPKHIRFIGNHELNTYSLVSHEDDDAQLEFHDIFRRIEKDGGDVFTLNRFQYQNSDYISFLKHLQPGMIIGFGHRYSNEPRLQGVSMSHGGMITRVSGKQAWIGMASELDGRVVEKPLLGPGGVYEYYLSNMNASKSPKHTIYATMLSGEGYIKERDERIAHEPASKLESSTYGGICYNFDEYSPYFLASTGGLPNCVRLCRGNIEKVASGMRKHILYGNAGSHDGNDGVFDKLEALGANEYDIVDYCTATRGNETSAGPILFRKIKNDRDIISSSTVEALIPDLDMILAQANEAGVLPVAECYIGTTNRHKIPLVYGRMNNVEGWYVIDTLRGNGVMSLYSYFSSGDHFYHRGDPKYHTLYLRKDGVVIG